jgi:hypothetical protein
MLSGKNAWVLKVVSFSQELMEGKSAPAHSVPILSAFAEQQELLAIEKVVKGLASEI